MYDKFFLSDEQLNKIKNFTSDQILLIYGNPGIGKTTLAKEILKDSSITIIDSLFLKKGINIYEYILNIIQKKNIMSLMYNQDIKRGIIIDDIDIFYKYDKKTYNLIIDLFITQQYYGSKIIITCNTKFINNRKLIKLNYISLYLNYNKFLMHKIINNISRDNNKDLSVLEKEKLLNKSNYNLNNFISLLKNNYLVDVHQQDNKYKNPYTKGLTYTEELTYRIILDKGLNMTDVINHFINDRITISLNLLDNIYKLVPDLSLITKIYNFFVLGDLIETKYTNCMCDYYCIYTIYYIYLILRNQNHQIQNIKNNNYISHSLILIHNYKIYNSFIINKDLIYAYLYIYDLNIGVPKFVINFFKDYEKNVIDYFIKSFNYFYKSKIKINKFIKFINNE